MDSDVSHPQISPSHFDLTVVGTGLPESLIAAAASAIGKSVLHLDPNSFYGGHFSSLSLDEFTYFLELQRGNKEGSQLPTLPFSETGSSNYVEVGLKIESLYSDVEVSSLGSSDDIGPSRKFSLDLCGPRILYRAESSVSLMLKSGAIHHVEFKNIDASFIYGDNGELFPVPDSRGALFSNKSFELLEKDPVKALVGKKRLEMFFNLVQEHFSFNESKEEQLKRISDEDLETPFIDFLTKQQLSSNIKRIILYAIAMVDYDQEGPCQCMNPYKTKDGIETLALYFSSLSRDTNKRGPFIYPVYGQGELPQAFCRAAAVKGALYVLHMPVRGLLFDKESREYKGLRLVSGQEVFSNQLVMGPSLSVPSQSVFSSLSKLPDKIFKEPILRDVTGQVARAVCISRASIKPEISNLLVVFPPKSLSSKQLTSVRALQLCSDASVCPPNLFVWYLSTLCDDAGQGKESLRAAIDVLVKCSASKKIENENVEALPTLLWSALYSQQLTKVSSDAISMCPTPDGNLDYRDMLESTEKLFQKLYPNEEFMPETNAPRSIIDEEIVVE
ncbi:hypothetical protein ACHQM5_009574 [Ranunculus cassubicifolius]